MNLKNVKTVLYPFVISGLVLSGFVISQKNKSVNNPFQGDVEAAACNTEFIDRFNSDKSKIQAGSEINVTVNGEYYTTDGPSLVEIAPGNAGVRIRNFYDSMDPETRHGGNNYADQWNIGSYIDPDAQFGAESFRVKKNGGSYYTNADLQRETVSGNINQAKIKQTGEVVAKQDYVRSGQDDNNGGSLRLWGRRYDVVNSGQDLVIPLGASHAFPSGSSTQGSFSYTSEWKYNKINNAGIGPEIEGQSSAEPYDYDDNGKIDTKDAPYRSHIGFNTNGKNTSTQYAYDSNGKGLILETAPGTAVSMSPTIPLYQWNQNSLKFVDPDNNGSGSAHFQYNNVSKDFNVLTNWNVVTGVGGLGALTDGRSDVEYEIQVRKVKVDWATTGQIDSADIIRPSGGFNIFEAQSELPAGTNVIYQIIDSASGNVLKNNVVSGSKMNDIGASKIRLRAILSRTNYLVKTPVLKMWRVGCNSSLSVVGTPTVSCTTGLNPFSLDFSLSTKSLDNKVVRNKVFMLPKDSASPATLPVNYSGSPVIILDTASSNNTIGNGATYSGKFTSAATAVWEYTITFDKNQNGYKAFYDKGGFDLYVYIEDQTSDNLILVDSTSYIPKAAFAYHDPFQDCARPYYKTFSGDYRSNEKTNYSNIEVTIKGPAANKFWQPATPAGTYKGAGNNSSDPDINQPVSSFSAEIAAGAQNCANTLFSAIPEFCSTVIDGPGISQNDALDQIGRNIEDSVSLLRNLNKIEVGNPSNNFPSNLSASQQAISITGPNDNRSVVINIGELDAAYTPLLIDIPFGSGITDVTINDNVNTNPATINDVIVWCKTANCVMHINPVKSFTQNEVTMSGNKLLYPSGTTNVYAKDKGRLYLNFHSMDELQPFSSARKVYLEGSTASSYYLGAVMTDGYLIAGKGTGTDIIKGFVLARGIVVRDNGNNLSDGDRNKYLIFKDFPKPFMYIDYDAKYLLTYRQLLVRPIGDVDRKYLGL